ncbi:putative O-methyltransferase YrrM [Anoxybacillus tepidamans]|uniref:tRNA 5-hydroxyuridine methyltransferase n=1 Tax=Anoxybacteroides tepidamans TaxID=265948 RepID=A0A7W8IS77_9BACL|nr:O-methyltransferase [Anoxybacillus tepidamans]MBB5324847.1 putative O-methyltransferase YrrM [Anoxybacillus tepidamans]
MLSEELVRYVETLIPNREPIVQEMEAYAKEHRVPIMDIIGIEAMLYILQIIQPKSIFEIGTAIGYSAIRMAMKLPDARIVTVERDQERYERALFYMERTKTCDQIDVLFGDALELYNEVEKHAPFDVMFIDAAKGQYERFFRMYEPLLADGGVVITDNVLFKGLVAADAPIENKRMRQLAKKIREYNEWLMRRLDYDTVILPIGDGIAISKKRGEMK